MSNSGNNHIPIDKGSFLNGKEYKPTNTQLYLYYQYPSLQISSDEVNFKKRDQPNSRIESIFSYNSVTPQFLFGATSQYKTSKLFITSLVHNIFPGITEKNNEALDADGNPKIVGELIIKHTSISGNSDLYSCFFLEKSSSGNSNSSITQSNNIDSLIFMADKTNSFADIDIGKDIPSGQQAISYDSKGAKVVCFLSPIKINKESADIVKDLQYDFEDKFLGTSDNIQNDTSISGSNKTFLNHPSDQTGSNNDTGDDAGGTANLPEMPEGSDYYLDCKPTGESAETIAHYQIPIQSEYTENAQKMDAQKTAMNFIIFIIIIAVVYLAIPPMYKFIIYDRIIQLEPPNQKATKTRSLDWTLFILFFIFLIIISYSNPRLTIIYIIYGITFLALTMMLIISEKNSNPLWKRILDYSTLVNWKNTFGPELDNFVKTFFGVLIYPFFKTGINKPNTLGIVFTFILWLLITLCVIFIPPADKDGAWIDKNGLLYLFLILLSAAISGLIEFIMNPTSP